MAVAAVVAMVATAAVGAVPATAVPVADVPPNAADWATTPYSPLPPAEVAVDNELDLSFDGVDGGLRTGADVGTGFTMVQPSSADPTYYLPENLEVADGRLTVTATKGIAYTKPGGNSSGLVNQQENTLGVGVDTTDTNLRFTTTLTSPAAATSSAQAGLWFGPDDDNYVKLALVASSTTSRQIQLAREIGGVMATGSATAPTADQVMVDTTQAALGTQPITLTLDINTLAGTMTGHFRVGDGAEQTVGTLELPATFHNGSLLKATMPDVTSFGGLFATKRNMAESAALAYSFDSFSLTETDSEPPAAPTGLTATGSQGQVELAWDASDVSSDVTGYRVYRGASAPVATTGNGIGGSALLTTPKLTDTGVFIGSSYHYAVVAVDAAGNISAPAEIDATVPAVDGEEITKVNFQTAAAPVPAGYTADTGLPYDAARGAGWTNATSGAPLDVSQLTRLRSGAGVTTDPRLATIAHMQHTSMTAAGAWRYDLPNGTYTVVVAVGDTGSAGGGGYDSTHVIRAEGTPIVDRFVPSSAREYDEAVGTVEVTDGSLTIDPVGGSNTKIAYVEIYGQGEETPAAPAAPTGLMGTAADGGVVLDWSASEGATGYDVFRATEPTVPTDGAPLNPAPITDTAFVDQSVEPGQTYYYAVVARGEGGASAPSAVVEVVVDDASVPPAAPADLTADATDDGVQLTWTVVEGAAGYAVYRSTSPTVETEGEPLNGTPVVGTNYLDTAVQAGGTYYYAVIALGEDGTRSEPSTTVEITLTEEPTGPGVPTGLDAQLVGDTAQLTWNPVAGATGYHVYRSTTEPVAVDGEPLNGAAPLTAAAYTDLTIAAGTTYFYVVVALDGDGVSSAPSNPARVVVPDQIDACAPGQWSAAYFEGTELAGAPAGRECVDAIDVDWGS
ncbi:hypothetical protein GB883_10290, partial [Georgenia thermotolerans]